MVLRFERRDRASIVAGATLWIVLGFVLANLLFNAVANELHAPYPYSSFLSLPGDRFGDFFKLAYSYPGPPMRPASGFWRVNELLSHHLADVKLFEGTNVNHFHEPPLPTLFALSARWLMSFMDPVLLFLGSLAAALGGLFATVLRFSTPGRAGAALATATLLSYPALFAIDRGHLFSLICASLMIAACFRTLRGQADGWSILMFAIALNFRPNMGIIPFVLLVGKQGLTFRSALLLGVTSVLMFFGTLEAVHAVYPPYSFHSFLAGLGQYAMAYGGGEIGYSNGSSLYGMLRATLGYAPWIVFVPFCVGGLFLAPAVLESRQGRVNQAECLFLALSAYVFASHVFADYHLLLFVIPLMLIARDNAPLNISAWAIVMASSLMLAPKNFIFAYHGNNPWSWQVVANPLILVSASAIVLWAAWRRNRSANEPSPIGQVATYSERDSLSGA